MPRTWLLGLLLAGLSPPAGWAAPIRYILEPEHAHVRVAGRSTLHGFEGETSAVRGEITFDPQQDQLAAPARLAVPVSTIRTGNSARDRAMLEMFDAGHFPEISVTIDAVSPLGEPAAGSAAPRRYRLQGRLRIRDIEQPVDFEVEAVVTDQAIDASGALPLTTTMFELKPPSVLGVVRVRKEITVEFTSHWTRQP
jgi:polyisoprenoid-binding protein YceI